MFAILPAPWRRFAGITLAICLSALGARTVSGQDVYFNQEGPVDWNATDGMWQNAGGTLFVVPAINAPPSGGFSGYGNVNAQINNGGTVEINSPTQPVTWQFVNSSNNTWGEAQPPAAGGGTTDSILFVNPGGTLRAEGGPLVGDPPADPHNEIRIGAWAGPNKGVLFQLGGEVYSQDEIGIGIQGGARGEYNLAEGTAISDGELRLGVDAGSEGTMNQFGGRAEFGLRYGEGLNLGLNGNGVYNIDGPTAVLHQNQSVSDWAGNGDAAWNYIGHNRTARGELNISNGATVSLMGRTHVGFSNQTNAPAGNGGFVNQTGGLFEVRNHELIIGDGDAGNPNAADAGGRGVYNISGGELRTARDVIVGHWANSEAELNVSGDAVVNPGFSLIVGNTGDPANAEIAGKGAHGRLTVADVAQINVRDNFQNAMLLTSTADILQTGGQIEFGLNAGDHEFNLGYRGEGTYDISGGILRQADGDNGWNRIGRENGSKGTMRISGDAVVSFNNRTHLGAGPGSEGTVEQSGGLLEVRSSELVIGDDEGIGSYRITGGTVDAQNVLVGNWTNSNGTLEVSDTAVVRARDDVIVGNGRDPGVGAASTGLLNQHGGEVQAVRDLIVGNGRGDIADNGANGRYDLSDGTLIVGRDATIGNFGNGNFQQTGGTNRIEGNLMIGSNAISTGLYRLGGGLLDMTGGDINKGAGTAVFVMDGGILLNAANVNFSLENLGGAILPGDGAGVTNIAGDYMQATAGEYEAEIGGLAAGTEYDVLDVTGVATLGGTLDVELIDGFSPAIGDEFVVLRGNGGVVGEFDNVDFSAAMLSSGSWAVTYLPNQVVVGVVPEPGTIGLALVAAIAGIAVAAARRRRRK